MAAREITSARGMPLNVMGNRCPLFVAIYGPGAAFWVAAEKGRVVWAGHAFLFDRQKLGPMGKKGTVPTCDGAIVSIFYSNRVCFTPRMPGFSGGVFSWLLTGLEYKTLMY